MGQELGIKSDKKLHEFALKRGFMPIREGLMEDAKVLRKASKWKGFQTTRRKLQRAKTFCKNRSVLRTEKRLKKTVILFSKTCTLDDK